MVAIVQARPLVELPSHRPSRGAVTAMFEHHPRGLGQLGRRHGRDGVSWVQAEEVVHVAMLVFRVIDVGGPLHELTVASYLVRRDVLQRVFPLPTVFLALAQHAAGLHGVGEHLTYHGMGERGALVHGAMLGRRGGRGGIYAVGTVPQIVGGEVGRTFQYVIIRLKEMAVAGIVIVVPEVGGEPRPGEWREVPRHVLA